MNEGSSLRERLDEAAEAKGLSDFPHLKRAVQRSRFIVVLFAFALALLVYRAFSQEVSLESLALVAADAAAVIGFWVLSLKLVRSFENREWARMVRLLDVSEKILLTLVVLLALLALAQLATGSVAGALVSALAAVVPHVWRRDYVRGKEDLLARLSEPAPSPH